jgi:hypothetical protein
LSQELPVFGGDAIKIFKSARPFSTASTALAELLEQLGAAIHVRDDPPFEGNENVSELFNGMASIRASQYPK